MSYPHDPTYRTEKTSRYYTYLNNIKYRANNKKLDYNLDIDWYLSKINKGVCEATGIPFELPKHTGTKGAKNPWVPSVDRIDPDKGYTKDNCQVVIHLYNLIKNQWKHEDVITFCRGVLIGEAAKKRQRETEKSN